MEAVKEIQGTKKPVKLINVAAGAEFWNSLNHKAALGQACPAASLSKTIPKKEIGTPRPPEEVMTLAREFIDEYYASIRRSNSDAHVRRWENVVAEIKKTGSYELTETELAYGAKMAWRNSRRCIGRIQWQRLQVFDARRVTTTYGMFQALCNHIKYVTSNGNVKSSENQSQGRPPVSNTHRPAITIFPKRTEKGKDFRIWNPQLIAFAGYRQPDGSIVGDPISVDFTEVCQKLGWKGKMGRFDVLPLVLSANGQNPDFFDLPEDLVLTIHLKHPKLPWFESLGLQWLSVPGVAGMLFDVGGVEFPGAPFSGWFLVTEIAARDLCDPQRYDILGLVAEKMGFDVNSPPTTWQGQALEIVHTAVMHSYQAAGVTITDQLTASEAFMKYMENEYKLRGGCPADWALIAPSSSGSTPQVVQQELAPCYLKPSYEYQLPPWETHVWKKASTEDDATKPRRKLHYVQLARAVSFTAKLFQKALSKRIKATILYATETGKSEKYAKLLGEIFSNSFNAKVIPMNEYDIIELEHEALVLVVASTVGNGDPPENGEEFAKNLYASKMEGVVAHGQKITEDMMKSVVKETMTKKSTKQDPTGGQET